MANSFMLEIVTPEKLFYLGKAELVIVKTLTGEEGFMAGHSWACKLLGTGELCFREAGAKEYRVAAVSGGFIDVRDQILVFTDSAEWPEEIDIERANEASRREQEWLEQNIKAGENPPEEIEEHKQAAQRAVNRQKVAAGSGRRRH